MARHHPGHCWRIWLPDPAGIQETVIAGGVALAGVVGAVMPDSVKK